MTKRIKKVKSWPFSLWPSGTFSYALAWFAIALAAGPIPLAAQQILVQQDTVFENLAAEGYHTVEISNGPFTYKSAQTLEDTDLGPFLPFLLAVLAQDAIAAGHFTIETEVFRLIPDTIEQEAFVTPIRVGHLLTHSAGFALPPVDATLYRGRFAPLMMRQRTPGRLITHDPVGLTLLARVLEATTKTSLATLIFERFLAPKGLAADQIRIDKTTLLSGQIGKAARAHLLSAHSGRPVYRLQPDQQAAIFKDPLVEPFRGGSYASLGFRFDVVEATAMIVSKGPETCILAFPQAGLSIWIADVKACQYPYPQALVDIARDQVIDRIMADRLKRMQSPPANVRYPDRFSGHFVIDSPPRADLKNRLVRLYDGGLRARTLQDGSLQLQSDTFSRILTPTRAYTYVDDAGHELIFSTYRRGGFLSYEGQVYRDLALLARRDFVLWPVPIMLLVLLSAGFHWRQKAFAEWRRMAKLGVLSSLFLTAGLIAEITLWQPVLFGGLNPDLGPWLVTFWRFIMNAGLAFSVAIAILCLIISRQKKIPDGPLSLIAPLHLGLLAAAGVGIIFLMSAWGMTGELWPF